MPRHPTAPAEPTPPAALTQAVTDAGFADAQSRWHPLEGGRSNRLWRVTGPSRAAQDGAEASLVVKLFARPDDNPLFANDPKREAQVLQHLEGQAIAPHYRAALTVDGQDVLIYGHVGGTIWHRSCAPVARLLRALHDLAPPSGPLLPKRANGSAALAAQTATIVDLCPPDTARPMRALLRDLAGREAVPPTPAEKFLHGDPVAGNVICGADGLRLIDWQCPAVGDPCDDLAHFLSPAMQHIYRGAALTRAEAQEFLAAYGRADIADRAQALAPWYHARTAAYCLWQSARGAADYEAGFALECGALRSAIAAR